MVQRVYRFFGRNVSSKFRSRRRPVGAQVDHFKSSSGLVRLYSRNRSGFEFKGNESPPMTFASLWICWGQLTQIVLRFGRLERQEGDIVRVIESVGNGWLFGEDLSGRRGQFPESFVRLEHWVTYTPSVWSLYLSILLSAFASDFLLFKDGNRDVFNWNQLWRLYINIHILWMIMPRTSVRTLHLIFIYICTC